MDFNSFLQYVFQNLGNLVGGPIQPGANGQLPEVENDPIGNAVSRGIAGVRNAISPPAAAPVTSLPPGAGGPGDAAMAQAAQQDAMATAGASVPPPGAGASAPRPLGPTGTGAPVARDPGGPQLGPRLPPGGAPGAPGFAPRPPAGTGAASPGAQAGRFRNQALFADEDPQGALVNAMLDSGMNPYSANPFMRMMMERAPGLQAQFLMNQAGSGQGASAVDAAGGMGTMLREHLMGALAQGEGMDAGISQARGQVGNLPGMLNDYARKRALGQLTTDENPFIGMLEGMMSNPQGAQSLISSLTTPGLGSDRLSTSYNRALGAVMQGAQRNQADNWWADTQPSGDPLNPSLGANFWNYFR